MQVYSVTPRYYIIYIPTRCSTRFPFLSLLWWQSAADSRQPVCCGVIRTASGDPLSNEPSDEWTHSRDENNTSSLAWCVLSRSRSRSLQRYDALYINTRLILLHFIISWAPRTWAVIVTLAASREFSGEVFGTRRENWLSDWDRYIYYKGVLEGN